MPTLLVSDQEREYTVGLLRGHWLTGRLTAEEFEQRVAEAWRARSAQDLWQALRWLPAQPVPVAPVAARKGSGTAVASLVLSVLGLCLLVLTFGLAFFIALPLFASGWILGRAARRSDPRGARSTALTGEVIGAVGTTLCVLVFAGCAAILA